MAWTKIDRSKMSVTGRRPNTHPSISRSTKKKDIGHLTVPTADTSGMSRFNVLVDDAGNMGFDFDADGEYKVQAIKTNPTMVRLNIPKKLLVDYPTGTHRVELRHENGLLVLDKRYRA